MKKGLWLSLHQFHSSSSVICWNHWPDEKGIVTFMLSIITVSFLPCWNHWPDEKGIVTIWQLLFCQNMFASWNHWPDEKGIVTINWNLPIVNTLYTVGIIDLMKKGLWLKTFMSCFKEGSRLESLTWWEDFRKK